LLLFFEQGTELESVNSTTIVGTISEMG